MTRLRTLGCAFVALMMPASALAQLFPDLTLLATLAGISPAQVSATIQTVALGADHRPYMSAKGTGMAGFDLGVELTGFTAPSQFAAAMGALTGGQAPSTLLIPKINLHKGLPGGLDVGISVFYWQLAASSNPISSFGGDLKWTFFELPAGLALAIRGQFDLNYIWFFQTQTFGLDTLVSFPLVFIDPYVGVGAAFWNGSMNVTAGQGLTISNAANGLSPRVYIGCPLKLGIFRLTANFEYSFSGLVTYGGKVSFGWN